MPRGWHEHGPAARTLAAHEPVEHLGGGVAHGLAVVAHAGQRRSGEGAERLLVLGADDGDFLGDGDAGALAGFEQAHAELVVGREDADGLGQFL